VAAAATAALVFDLSLPTVDPIVDGPTSLQLCHQIVVDAALA